MPKIATTFGGAINDTSTLEYQESILIGKLLSSKSFMVRNGGYKGLMEGVSKGIYENKGFVTGITCGTFKSTKGNEYLTRNIVATDIFDRLKLLIDESSVFIVQRGGVGTLSEISLVIDIARKLENPPKIYLIGFIWKEIFDKILSDKEKQLLTFCLDYKEFETIFNEKN